MQGRYANTGLIVEASCMLHKMVGVLSDLDRGAAMRASGTVTRRVDSWRTRVASSRLELVIWPSRLVSKTKSAMMSGGQG